MKRILFAALGCCLLAAPAQAVEPLVDTGTTVFGGNECEIPCNDLLLAIAAHDQTILTNTDATKFCAAVDAAYKASDIQPLMGLVAACRAKYTCETFDRILQQCKYAWDGSKLISTATTTTIPKSSGNSGGTSRLTEDPALILENGGEVEGIPPSPPPSGNPTQPVRTPL